MGLYRETRLCASCTSGRFSKLSKGEIAPYRTKTANTFCQGPVAAERAKPRYENGKFADD